MSEKELREEFFQVVYDWSKAEGLLKKIKDAKNSSPLFIAYEGSCEVICSNNQSGIFIKFDYIKNGLKKLDHAVGLSSHNAEIRFLRFSIQHNIPGILGMSKDLDQDKNFILQNCSVDLLKDLKPDQLNYIVKFMEESGRCTKEEIVKLNRIVYGR